MKIMQFVRKEIQHFERISNTAQRLVISYFFYGIGTPFITTFMNAFIWKNSHDFISVCLYNIGNWMMLPFIFFINGILLQYISSSLLFVIGLILIALVPFSVVMFPINGYVAFLFVGMLFGVGFGLYWGNRNLFTLRLTEDKTRNYFFGLTYSIDLITGIIVPFVIGWIIVFGQTVAYQILAALLFLTYFAAGFMILPFLQHEHKHVHGLIFNIKGKWNLLRLVCVLFGFQSGNNFVIPSLIVLSLLGNEGILGTITALGALFSAIAIYEIGKFSQSHHRTNVFGIGIAVLIMGTMFFTLFPHGVGIIVYIVTIYISSNFTWSSYNPIAMDLMDRYTPIKKENRYKYIIDQEFFLNSGRIFGLGIFFLIYFLSSQYNALRFTPMIIASLQIVVVYLLRKIVI